MEATKPVNRNFNRVAYCIFLAAGLYFCITKDYNNAVIFWGLAPIFDPFDQKISFGKRPVYQRVILIVNVIATLTVLVLSLKHWF